MNEFEFIELLKPLKKTASVPLGIGDDAAVLDIPATKQLVVSSDNALEGVHFPTGSPLDKVAYRACVAALSDLAAMGAEPCWMMLSVTLPSSTDEAYKSLASGILEATKAYGVTLIGGNTTRGPLNLGVTVMGLVAKGEYVTRQAAKPGDGVYITGTLGDAALGLKSLQGVYKGAHADWVENRFWRPTARFEMLPFLKKVQASSCIDVSDGLKGDLEHLLMASAVGAVIDPVLLPLSKALQSLPLLEAQRLALTGGEDYELCFTAPKYLVETHQSLALCPVTCIGEVTDCLDLNIIGFDSEHLSSYHHFL